MYIAFGGYPSRLPQFNRYDVSIPEVAKGKGGEIEEPIQLTHTAEIVDNPSSNDDSFKKKINVHLPCSSQSQVTAVGSLPDVSISEVAKGKVGEIDEPIQLTHTAEIVDNPSSNDDSFKKKINVHLPCSSQPQVGEAQHTYQWQHSLHRSPSRKKQSLQRTINQRKSEEISARLRLPQVPKGHHRGNQLHTGTSEDSSLASLCKLAMEDTQQEYAVGAFHVVVLSFAKTHYDCPVYVAAFSFGTFISQVIEHATMEFDDHSHTTCTLYLDCCSVRLCVYAFLHACAHVLVSAHEASTDY
uniref:Uncharacterized protein n=1 Tax=Ascaris lumbricoides TaxID=6252 RepID=A0A9J2PLC5_ASCLU